MKTRFFPLLLISAIVISACNNSSSSTDGSTVTLSAITTNTENPTSIFLGIVDKIEEDTAFSYITKGLFEGDTVGLVIEVAKDILPGVNADDSVNEADGFRTGSITFHSAGVESDAFVSALAKLWGLGDSIYTMTSSPVKPLVFSSNKVVVDHTKPTTSSYKLFFDPESRNAGEVFFTLDNYRRFVEFQEKDSIYRVKIMQAFVE